MTRSKFSTKESAGVTEPSLMEIRPAARSHAVVLRGDEASRFSAPVPPTARFDRLLLAPGAICG